MGLGGALATGMAFGGGSAVGHALVGSMMGGRGHSGGGAVDPYQSGGQVQNATPSEGNLQQTEQQPQNVQQSPCFDFSMKFVDCLKTNEMEISKCQNFFNDLIRILLLKHSYILYKFEQFFTW